MLGVIVKFLGSPISPTLTTDYQEVFNSSQQPRSGVLVKVIGYSPVDIHNSNDIDEKPWYSLNPGATKIIPWASGISIFVKGGGQIQMQEVTLG